MYIYILYALRDSAEAIKAWRLEPWCEECEGPQFCVLCGLCGVLGDFWVYLGVPGGSLGFPWDYLGGPLELLGASGRSLGGAWGAPGTPQGALEIIEKPLVFIVFSAIGRSLGFMGALGGSWEVSGGVCGIPGSTLGAWECRAGRLIAKFA